MSRINYCLKEFALLSSGQTLLAIQAPCGTQLDVPIPKAVSSASLEPHVFILYCFLEYRWNDFVCAFIFFQVQNCPAKYQIHLKSVNGPIDIVLLNKLSVSSLPVVLPVPPSEELLRSAKLAMFASRETESSIAPCQASASIRRGSVSIRAFMEDMLHLQSSSPSNAESHRTDTSKCECLRYDL